MFGALDDVPQESGVGLGLVGWSRDDVSAAARCSCEGVESCEP